MENGVSVKLDKILYKQLKQLSNKEGRFFTTMLNQAVKNYLKAKKAFNKGNKK